MESKEMLYEYIRDYAEKKSLNHTLTALPLTKELMENTSMVDHLNVDGITRYRGHFEHALQVCSFMINLGLPLESEDEDICLAAALCHVIPNAYNYSEMENVLLTEKKMDPRICEIISLIINDTDLSSQGQTLFYNSIKENRLALIVFLADRANVVQKLYSMSIWSAREYIFETRSYFLPLCIEAKECYPELIHVLNILMEKVRTLVDACMILLTRYETREMELTEDILNYQEENARIRGIIRHLKEEK